MTKRSPEHIKAQRAGRARDYETCQACGSKQNVQGHHIFDHQFLGAATEENIVSLCQNCHKKVHSGKLDIIKFQKNGGKEDEI